MLTSALYFFWPLQSLKCFFILFPFSNVFWSAAQLLQPRSHQPVKTPSRAPRERDSTRSHFYSHCCDTRGAEVIWRPVTLPMLHRDSQRGAGMTVLRQAWPLRGAGKSSSSRLFLSDLKQHTTLRVQTCPSCWGVLLSYIVITRI